MSLATGWNRIKNNIAAAFEGLAVQGVVFTGGENSDDLKRLILSIGDDKSFTDCRNLFENGRRAAEAAKILLCIKQVGNAEYMFNQCGRNGDKVTNLQSVLEEGGFFDKLKTATNCYGAFNYANAFTSIPDITFINTCDVRSMFTSMEQLNSIGYLTFTAVLNDTFDTMFRYNKLTSIDGIAVGDMAIVDCPNAFRSCTNLKRIGELKFKPRSMSYMFEGCYNLEEFPEMDLSECNDMYACFKGTLLSGIFDLSNVKKCNSYANAFYGCTQLQGVTNIYANTANNVAWDAMFPYGTSSISSIFRVVTFHPDTVVGGVRGMNLSYCSIDRENMLNFFNSLPTITASGDYATITITGNPCITDGTLTEEDRAVATSKGWVLAE